MIGGGGGGPVCLRAASGAQGGATPRSSSFITTDGHRPPARLQAAAWAPEPGLFPLNHSGSGSSGGPY